MIRPRDISVVGLGYVGLPLAIALARHHRVVGFDTDRTRIEDLRAGHDRTNEVSGDHLNESTLRLTDEPMDMSGGSVFIITVPTPVDAANQPDLSAVRKACEIVGSRISTGAIVVLESTVWPGVTEEICGPALERISGLACGQDFFLGYSPERMNPGDRAHTVDKIIKVVAGQTSDITATLAELYGSVTECGVFVAKDIRTAEAAKVIENAQRDINIAFVNEVAMVNQKLGLSTRDVLEAAATKWNFHEFTPGLVGGHCIGVDPYYLAHRAQELGHYSEVILAGRRINDGMGRFVASQIADSLGGQIGDTVLVLGLAFKENVPDLRNNQVVNIVGTLSKRGYLVAVHDPLADPAEAKQLYGIDLLESLAGASGYAAVIGAVAHDLYRGFCADDLAGFLNSDGLVADVTGIWHEVDLPAGLRRWEL